MKKLILLSILFAFTGKYGKAQSVDSLIVKAAQTFLNGGPRVGVSVGVIANGQTYSFSLGKTDKEKTKVPDHQTIYEIGSITKTFTSRLLAQAVIEKRAALTDDIRKYLKEEYPNLQYNGKPIQLIHLANLTSGLPDNLPEKIPSLEHVHEDSIVFELQKVHELYAKDQFMKDLHDVKLTRDPGASPSHSNTAAELLGFILENIYPMSYESLLQKYITKPLEMNSTFVTVPPSQKLRSAKGYNKKGIVMPRIPKDAGSAGVLTSTLDDMLKYVNYNLKEKDELVVLCHKPSWGDPASFAIGLNWTTNVNFDGKRKVWASGGTFGFASYCILYPERGFAVVALSNENDEQAEDGLANLAQTIYNQFYFTAAQRASDAFGFSANINKLLTALDAKGFDHVTEAFAELKKNDKGFIVSEDELNNWGYSFLGKGKKEKALEIFKLNTALFPESSNTWDSLAETYESMGDKPAAIRNYKKALELNPSSDNAVMHLKSLEGR